MIHDISLIFFLVFCHPLHHEIRPSSLIVMIIIILIINNNNNVPVLNFTSQDAFADAQFVRRAVTRGVTIYCKEYFLS